MEKSPAEFYCETYPFAKFCHDVFLEYVNDYLTIERMSEHKGVSVESLRSIIKEGRRINRLNDKCIVNGCENRKGEGRFRGDICAPCFSYLSSGTIGPTNSFLKQINELKNEISRIKKNN